METTSEQSRAEETAIGAGDRVQRKGANMRKHFSADTRADGYNKPIPDILAIIKDSYAELRPADITGRHSGRKRGERRPPPE